MAKEDEGTLFRPDPKLQYPGAGFPAAAAMRGGDDDDEPQVALKERFFEAARSAGRRKGQTFVVILICAALTAVAAVFAPRTYVADSEVLVAKTQALGGGPAGWVNPEEDKKLAKEYEKQIIQRDNVLAIIRQAQLVERWDEMRQPHRRLLDKLNRKMGKAAPSEEAKLDALVGQLEGRLQVEVDSTTVLIRIEWSDPVAARDIVAAAVKNFQEARFSSEVGVLPEQLRILETSVAQAQSEVATTANELQLRQVLKDKDKERVRQLLAPAARAIPASADPALVARLEVVRQERANLEGAKLARIAELTNQLTEMQQTLAPGHPSVVALKATLAATQADSPQLAAVKEREKQLLAQIDQSRADAAAKSAANSKVAPPPGALEPAPPPIAEDVSKKSTADLQAQFDAAQEKFKLAMAKLEEARINMKTAEAAFRHRYTVTHPAEVPAGPKRPVGLLAIVAGFVLTVLASLVSAALADRLSGLFFEPREVRDRLGLPVYATFT